MVVYNVYVAFLCGLVFMLDLFHVLSRSVYGVYSGDVLHDDITLWRFRAPRTILESATENPDNAGFCSPPGNCMGGGVLNMSQCQTCE